MRRWWPRLPDSEPEHSGRYHSAPSDIWATPLEVEWPPGARQFIIACRISSDGRKNMFVAWYAHTPEDAEAAFLAWKANTRGGAYVLLDHSYLAGEGPGRYFVRASLIDWWTVLVGD